MKATLTIEVPDDFEKGDYEKCRKGQIYHPYGTLIKVICTYNNCDCNADNCPLEIQDAKPVCNDCVLCDYCGYYRKDGECLIKF